MESSPYREVASSSDILWNPKVHHRISKSPPLVHILSEINAVHTTPTYYSKIYFNIIPHLGLGLPSGLFPSGFPTKIVYKFIFYLFVLHELPISFSFTESF
jgi:hypothetical protein